LIVRLLNEGQWRVDDSVDEELSRLDDEAMAALERNDEESLDATLAKMGDIVRTRGEELPADDLSTSDVIIPPPDLTLEETRQLFSEAGLIPDLPA
jgi:chromosome condensin MukBEF complex kleisin-like MukF subunit